MDEVLNYFSLLLHPYRIRLSTLYFHWSLFTTPNDISVTSIGASKSRSRVPRRDSVRRGTRRLANETEKSGSGYEAAVNEETTTGYATRRHRLADNKPEESGRTERNGRRLSCQAQLFSVEVVLCQAAHRVADPRVAINWLNGQRFSTFHFSGSNRVARLFRERKANKRGDQGSKGVTRVDGWGGEGGGEKM